MAPHLPPAPAPVLRRDRVTTVLDIGSGGGDLPRALARWADRDGYRVRITAVDPDRGRTAGPPPSPAWRGSPSAGRSATTWWRVERRRPWRLLLIHQPGRAGTG